MTQRAIRKITRVTMSIESMKTVEIVEIASEASTPKERVTSVHPGKILRLEFLDPFNISIEQLARETGMATNRISEIVSGKRRITNDTASRLSKYFGVRADYWLDLQTNFDVSKPGVQATGEPLRLPARRVS